MWYIQYGKEVESWLNKLNKEQFEAIDEEIELLRLLGNSITMPHSRPLAKGLFELREKRFGLRVYYMFDKGKLIILLGAGDKSSQDKDINKARKKMIEYKKG